MKSKYKVTILNLARLESKFRLIGHNLDSNLLYLVPTILIDRRPLLKGHKLHIRFYFLQICILLEIYKKSKNIDLELN
jgi:hypothetical protein